MKLAEARKQIMIRNAPMTQRQLAKRAGVSLSTITNIESGWNAKNGIVVKEKTIKRIARALKVDVAELEV